MLKRAKGVDWDVVISVIKIILHEFLTSVSILAYVSVFSDIFRARISAVSRLKVEVLIYSQLSAKHQFRTIIL